MKFLNTDFFLHTFEEGLFDGIITDPPYKKCVKGKLNEAMFDVAEFLEKADKLTKPNAFLICFSNFAMILDLRSICQNTNWKFRTYQIWDKSARVRNWIAWSMPLRTCEFILFFTKGEFKFNFKTGEVKPPVHRNSFGGKLKETSENNRENSFGMYSEIVNFQTPKNKIHPTQKPIEFSAMFQKIVKNIQNPFVLDCFCGSGSLLRSFPNSIGVDVIDWNSHAKQGTLDYLNVSDDMNVEVD